MATEVRQGLGLVCVALITLLASVVMKDGQAAVVTRGAALLFGIGGLASIALGLFRR